MNGEFDGEDGRRSKRMRGEEADPLMLQRVGYQWYSTPRIILFNSSIKIIRSSTYAILDFFQITSVPLNKIMSRALK
jgi:hypothetical protein